jgi:hypothetical protein
MDFTAQANQKTKQDKESTCALAQSKTKQKRGVALLHNLGITTGSIFVVLAGRVVGSWAIERRRVVLAGVRIANVTDVADSANTLGR